MGAVGVASEAVAHHCDGAGPGFFVVSGGEELHDTLGDDGDGDFHF